MKVKSESEVTQSVQLLAIPWTVAYQALPSMGYSRQEYWSGVPLPSPRINLDMCKVPVNPEYSIVAILYFLIFDNTI